MQRNNGGSWCLCASALLFCCFSPTSDGAAAAILMSEDYVKKHNLQDQAVEILAQVMTTDFPSAFEDNNCMKMASFLGNERREKRKLVFSF